MTNRLIWLLIILFFILLWLFYYYWVENSDKFIDKNSPIIPFNKGDKNNVKIKKSTLIPLKEKKDKNSVLSLSKEEQKDLENKIILKIQKKVSNILKNNNLKKNKILRILWNENLFLVKLLDKKSNNINYIYNNKKSNLEKIDLNIDIKYAKINNSKINLITKKWTFILKNNKLTYFPTFWDFIINNWEYIWIIKSEDKFIKNNFNYSEENWDLIVLYNPKKSIKRILYKPNFEIKNIYLEKNKIIVTDFNEKKYLLDY